MAQTSLAWMLSKPFITTPIVGTTSVKHIEEAVSALDITLDDRTIKKLEATLRAAYKNGSLLMKTIFITGASSGIGRETTKYFAAHGWRVMATMRNLKKTDDLEILPNVIIMPPGRD